MANFQKFMHTQNIRNGYSLDEQVNLIGMICISYLYTVGGTVNVRKAQHCKERPRTLRKVISELTGLDAFAETNAHWNSISKLELLCTNLKLNVKLYDSVDKHILFKFGIGYTDYSIHILKEELINPGGFNSVYYHQITNIDAFLGHIKPRIQQPGINASV